MEEFINEFSIYPLSLCHAVQMARATTQVEKSKYYFFVYFLNVYVLYGGRYIGMKARAGDLREAPGVLTLSVEKDSETL